MFYNCKKLTTFTSDLSSLTNGECMFYNCTALTSISSKSSSLFDGSCMFYECTNLNSVDLDLSSLVHGSNMFSGCKNLTTFTSDLSSLENGEKMFSWCSGLTTFTSDLSSLENGYRMFSSCSGLTTFASNLNSLTNGYGMFDSCSKLTSFTSNLSSLEDGTEMMTMCRLDTISLMHIAETIKEHPMDNKKIIQIGIGKMIGDEERELLTEIYNKGWNVFINQNGSNLTDEFQPETTTDETGEEISIPIPFWAKPVEVSKDKAQYIGQDGKYYIVLGGNYILVDDSETYGMFTSLEDAVANMRLTKIEQEEQNNTNELNNDDLYTYINHLLNQ